MIIPTLSNGSLSHMSTTHLILPPEPMARTSGREPLPFLDLCI